MDKESGGLLKKQIPAGIIVRPAYEQEWKPAIDLAIRTFERFDADDCTDEGRESFIRFVTDPELRRLERKGIYRLYVAGEMTSVYSSGNCAKHDLRMTGMMLIKDFSHISLLFVDSDSQGRGTGRRLVEYAFDTTRNFTGSLMLSVNSSTYAVPFYTRMGFMSIGASSMTDGLRSTPMIFKESYK